MLLIYIFLVLFLCSCISNQISPKEYTCIDCHATQNFKHSQLSCVHCHSGKDKAKSKEDAHIGLKANLSFSEIEGICSKCHQSSISEFKKTLHYTYQKELTRILRGFKVKFSINNMEDFEKLSFEPNSKEGIVVDFLKRRCLTCHIFSKGEEYAEIKRALYCFSCHRPHKLQRPSDKECLSCHYSTRIGWDYYGYYPHNWFRDYRSPLTEGKHPERPYGIEAYLLKEDIHKEKNFNCVDCHSKEEVMEGKKVLSCRTCHNTFKNKLFHQRKILNKVDCAVCHANFLAEDPLKICYLEFQPNLEAWVDLAVQESKEIEEKIEAFLLRKPLSYIMRDKFSGEEKKGLWLCTLSERNFVHLRLGKNIEGKLCLERSEKIILSFQDFELTGTFKTCKVPHSIGKGDIIRAMKVLKEFQP
ncbi:MAG: hypothetical protein ACK4Y7_01930 [Caldimicrobium sp.]